MKRDALSFQIKEECHASGFISTRDKMIRRNGHWYLPECVDAEPPRKNTQVESWYNNFLASL